MYGSGHTPFLQFARSRARRDLLMASVCWWSRRPNHFSYGGASGQERPGHRNVQVSGRDSLKACVVCLKHKWFLRRWLFVSLFLIGSWYWLINCGYSATWFTGMLTTLPAALLCASGWSSLRQKNPAATLHMHWVPYEQIAQSLKRAVIAAEDGKFPEHEGFDFDAMQKAYQKNLKKGGVVAGGSTISQQLAKNLFLSGEKTPGANSRRPLSPLCWKK